VPWSRPAAQRNRNFANHRAQGEKNAKGWCNSGALFAIIFASLLHACLALYVEQVNERKLVCAWCMEKLR
jgi:hypothetical protein